jgi:hypothetical protein
MLGVRVTGSDGKHHDLDARQRWSEGVWVTYADASREDEEDGGFFYPVLRESPVYRATDLAGCLANLRAALADLTRCDHLIPSPVVT